MRGEGRRGVRGQTLGGEGYTCTVYMYLKVTIICRYIFCDFETPSILLVLNVAISLVNILHVFIAIDKHVVRLSLCK